MMDPNDDKPGVSVGVLRWVFIATGIFAVALLLIARACIR